MWAHSRRVRENRAIPFWDSPQTPEDSGKRCKRIYTLRETGSGLFDYRDDVEIGADTPPKSRVELPHDVLFWNGRVVCILCDNMCMEVMTMAQQRTCPNCDMLNNQDAQFCQNCGLSFKTGYKETIRSGPPSPKQTTNPTAVLFVLIFLFLLFVWPGWVWPIFSGMITPLADTSNNKTISDVIEQFNPKTLTLLSWETKTVGSSTSVVGKIKNQGKNAVSYAQITFIVYDAAGNQIGTALDNINNLEAGATWAFDAVIFEDNVAKVKLGEITGF